MSADLSAWSTVSFVPVLQVQRYMTCFDITQQTSRNILIRSNYVRATVHTPVQQVLRTKYIQ